MTRYLKVWMVALSLLLFVMLLNQYTQSNVTQVNIDEIVDRVVKTLEGRYQLSERHSAPREIGSDSETAAPRPYPRLHVDWKDATAYFQREWNKPADIKCEQIEKAGNWEFCQDKEFKVKPPCLVYSFGIFLDWSFDEHMGKLGCEVHSFDPSIGKPDHIHSPGNVSFHNLGIGHRDTDTHEPELDKYVQSRVYWKVRTLKTIMKNLGHEGRKLDVLKMDVETDEWESLVNMVDSGMLPEIKQLLIEWHLYTKYPSKSRYSDYYHAHEALMDSGFKSYHKLFHHRTYTQSTITLQADANYLNTRFQECSD